VDLKTGAVLARYVDFNTDIPPIALGARRPGAYKIWMMRRSCEEAELPQQIRFNGYLQSVRLSGRK